MVNQSKPPEDKIKIKQSKTLSIDDKDASAKQPSNPKRVDSEITKMCCLYDPTDI